MLSWSSAEFLDVPCSGDALLRAMVCPLGSGKWQGLVLYLSNADGEVISVTMAKTAAEAREIAASELDKCIHDPIG
jgi:hypothetical protein